MLSNNFTLNFYIIICNENRNTVRKTNEYLIIWNQIKENINFDIHDNI